MPKDWETTLPVAALYRSGHDDLRLAIMGNEFAGTHQLPGSGTVSIGRASDATICLEDPSISRRHALLHLGGTLRLEDHARTETPELLRFPANDPWKRSIG